MTTATLPLISATSATTTASPTRFSRHRTTTTSLTLPLKTPSFTRTRCEVAVRADPLVSGSGSDEDEEIKSKLEKVGSKVRLKAPLKVYHVPRVPEVELTAGFEGVVKQYVGFWKGKRISANYPFKVEFSVEVEGRGKVKLFAHLREDEFDFVE